MTVRIAPMCMGCQHFHRQDRLNNTCDAFTDGIPAAILLSAVDHRQPYDGDHDLRFLPATPADAAYADVLFPPTPKDTPDVPLP